jgi:hypothetical protein
VRATAAAQEARVSRASLRALVDRAAASRAKIDETGLPSELLVALHDADALRIAVTPALVKDSAAIALQEGTIRRLEATVALKDLALGADSLAIGALRRQVDALTRQSHPRCDRRCAAVLGGVGVELIHQLPAIVRALIPRG